ncbi:MAG: hypothetical protein M5U01_38300 [Ardenticatenaceae bacterium]|nr:hypothetical protein [Ardenticatenaceae bacterium]HBY97632.1 hypothetical protein [Chloroflexota bacterium]
MSPLHFHYHLRPIVVLLISLTWAGLLPASGSVAAPIRTATPWWVDFWGGQTTLGSDPVPAGAVVRAYDRTGTVAGTFTVVATGWYGLMPVYGDDPLTAEDEGAQANEALSFSINGLPTVPLGPDAAIWAGTHRQVDLRGCSLVGDTDCDCRVELGDVLRVATRWGIQVGEIGYYPPYDADGTGIDAADVQRVARAWHHTCQ